MSPRPDQSGPRKSVRTKTLELEPLDDGTYRFCSSLIDRSYNGEYEAPAESLVIHDFEISGTIDNDLVLTALTVEAREHPFAQCPLAIAAASDLVGLSVSERWRRAVLDRLGSTAGCTHVTTLLLGLSEVITLVYFQRMNDGTPYGPRARASGQWIADSIADGARLVDACHALSADGPVVGRAQRHASSRATQG